MYKNLNLRNPDFDQNLSIILPKHLVELTIHECYLNKNQLVKANGKRMLQLSLRKLTMLSFKNKCNCPFSLNEPPLNFGQLYYP